jgi:flagellar biosynthetic protein FlhB
VLGALAVVVVPTVLISALAGYAQVGLRFGSKVLELDPARLSPARNLSRVLGLRGLVRAGLSAVKVALICAVSGAVAWLHLDEVTRVGTSELGPLLSALGLVALRTAGAALLVILALALLDLVFQRIQHERDLRMTRAEVKEEQRLTEGDPHVRARIRSIQRELATRRMMSEVPRATVVVTNPTHYAVALRYEHSQARAGAPRVVAKGVDHLAQRIKALAAQHGVRCHEDVPLARALYARVRVGQEIPEELYGAVAAVLATVYRLEGELQREQLKGAPQHG